MCLESFGNVLYEFCVNIMSKNNHIFLVTQSNTDFQAIPGKAFCPCCAVDSSYLAILYLVCCFTEEAAFLQDISA